MLQSDYLDLLSGPDVERVAANTYGVMEYVDRFDLLAEVGVDESAARERLTYHGHCHQKATKKDGHAATVLEAAGYEVDALDSGCCGMAGSFGYEAEHYSLSRKIGSILFEQVDDSDGDEVVAPGASCRTQLEATRATIRPTRSRNSRPWSADSNQRRRDSRTVPTRYDSRFRSTTSKTSEPMPTPLPTE